MLNSQKYVVSSLELHLFFGRIMKEHSLFLEAGFTPQNDKLSKEADYYKVQFEKLLLDTIRISDGVISEDVLISGELFTEFTLSTEEKTQHFTGININKKITIMESKLKCKSKMDLNMKMVNCVKGINKKAIKLLDGLIALKTKVLDDMLCCKIFTMNYPLLIEHIRREANLYRSHVVALESERGMDYKDIKESELFWNQIMMEHALFIRGLLDPSENKLIEASDGFAKDFAILLEKAKNMNDEAICSITNESLNETLKIRDFKKAGAKGINECQIKSIILPLLADHVLREANHYIRLLNSYEKKPKGLKYI